MKSSEEYIIAKEKAIKYIGISKKTKYEIVKKLKGLKIDPLVIDRIIKDLEELEYIDDRDYVKSYLSQNVKFHKYSKYEIKQKLLQKGINISIIEDRIEKLLPKDYENNVVKRLLATKLKDSEEIKKRQYLYRRGFESFEGEDDYE